MSCCCDEVVMSRRIYKANQMFLTRAIVASDKLHRGVEDNMITRVDHHLHKSSFLETIAAHKGILVRMVTPPYGRVQKVCVLGL